MSGRKCYITPLFSAVSIKGNKIGSGYTTHAFSGAQKRAGLLHNPCVLGGLHQRGQSQKSLHNPYLRAGLQEGGLAA